MVYDINPHITIGISPDPTHKLHFLGAKKPPIFGVPGKKRTFIFPSVLGFSQGIWYVDFFVYYLVAGFNMLMVYYNYNPHVQRGGTSSPAYSKIPNSQLQDSSIHCPLQFRVAVETRPS